jgi:hypothetical protein
MSFHRRVAVSENCPRCLSRDGVRVALVFRLLEKRGAGRIGSRLPDGLEEAGTARAGLKGALNRLPAWLTASG